MEKLSKVVVNKPYEESFEFLVVLVCFFFFHVGVLISIFFLALRSSCTIKNIAKFNSSGRAGCPKNFGFGWFHNRSVAALVRL